jgi:hypothetical protein
MPSVSVVIPHFWEQRRGNLVTIWRALTSGTIEPKEIIVWNNGIDLGIMPYGVSVIQAHTNIGCKARFLAAMCATSDFVLFQDNDLTVEPQTIQHLLEWQQKLDADGTLALEGRRMRPGKPYSECEGINGGGLREPVEMDITLGRMELVRRSTVNAVLADIPFTPETVMDDIWFSHVLQRRGIQRWCVPYTAGVNGFVNIEEGGVGAYRSGNHFPARNALCKQFFPC